MCRVTVFCCAVVLFSMSCRKRAEKAPVTEPSPSLSPASSPSPSPTSTLALSPASTPSPSVSPSLSPSRSPTPARSPSVSPSLSPSRSPTLTTGGSAYDEVARIISRPVVTYLAQDRDGENFAKVMIYLHPPVDAYFGLDVVFTALRDIEESRLGFPYSKLLIDFPAGDWEIVKTITNGYFKSSYIRMEEGKRKNFTAILKTLQAGDRFQIKFNLPTAFIRSGQLNADFNVRFYFPQRRGSQHQFISADSETPANGTFPL